MSGHEDRIGRHKSPKGARIVPRTEVIQARLRIAFFAGEVVLGGIFIPTPAVQAISKGIIEAKQPSRSVHMRLHAPTAERVSQLKARATLSIIGSHQLPVPIYIAGPRRSPPRAAPRPVPADSWRSPLRFHFLSQHAVLCVIHVLRASIHIGETIYIGIEDTCRALPCCA